MKIWSCLNGEIGDFTKSPVEDFQSLVDYQSLLDFESLQRNDISYINFSLGVPPTADRAEFIAWALLNSFISIPACSLAPESSAIYDRIRPGTSSADFLYVRCVPPALASKSLLSPP